MLRRSCNIVTLSACQQPAKKFSLALLSSSSSSSILYSSSLFISSLQQERNIRRRKINKSVDNGDDDGFGGGADFDDHDEFLQNFEQDLQQEQEQDTATLQTSTNTKDINQYPIDVTTTDELQHLQHHQQILDESESSQAIARVWPEILNLQSVAEASYLTEEAQFQARGEQVEYSSLAVKISRELVRTQVSEGASTSLTRTLLDVMKIEDVAFCFGVLQSVVEKTGTRLDEKFIADAAYRVFQADFDRSTSEKNTEATNQLLEVCITDEKSIMATATATTFKALTSSEFINDDYLNGIGLSKAVDLVEEMDVPSIVNLLSGLRKLNRTHFTFGEAEAYRKGASGVTGQQDLLPMDKSQEEQVDIFTKSGFTAMGRTNHREDPKHFVPETPSISDLLKDASFERSVVHPNLIDLLSQGIEKRLRKLIRTAFVEMKELEKKQKNGNESHQRKNFLLEESASNPALYKSKQEEDEMTMTITLDGDEEAEQNQTNNQNETTSSSLSPAPPEIVTSFIPICRSNELLELVHELCKVPSGIQDVKLWNDLSAYATKYFEWAETLTRFNHDTGRKEMMFETGQLLKLLPPLVNPIQALPDALDAIAVARRNKQNRFLPAITTNSSEQQQQQQQDENSTSTSTSLIPTFDLLSLISNTIAKSPRHISIIGYRNPELMRNLRRAFEVYPVLYETSPALWDVVRTSRIPKRTPIGQDVQSRTGIPRGSGKLGKLPPHITPIEPKRILSREIMQANKAFDPYWTSDRKPRSQMQAPKFKIGLQSDVRINKLKDKIKRNKFSKGSFHATRLSEASHQSGKD